MGLVLYGSGLSPFVRKVRVVLAEKGLEYKLEQINPFSPPPEFLEISPLRRIPVLLVSDLPEPNTLPDSTVICDYLETKYPQVRLYPADPFARGRALWFEEYADSAMAECIGRGLFFERVVKRMMRQQPDEELCNKTLTEKLPPLLDYLEGQLGSNEYLVGGALSIADISVATLFVNMEHAGEAPDAARWPRLAAYIARMHARPSFQAALAEERPLVARFRAG